jgi:SAM-dependent methyltransferase
MSEHGVDEHGAELRWPAGDDPRTPESEQFDEAFWDARYSSAHALWSGKPNRHLVTEADGLAPGTALDAGAGEGADAIWLARRGWRVTAVDISGVALERAAGHAAKAGWFVPTGNEREDVAARIQWLREDLLRYQPPERAYDLVMAQYLHLPEDGRRMLFARLAAAVADGGTLLIVGHHPLDLETRVPRPRLPGLFFTGDDLAKDLGSEGWEVVTNAASPHDAVDPEGRPAVVHDTVFRARRV